MAKTQRSTFPARSARPEPQPSRQAIPAGNPLAEGKTTAVAGGAQRERAVERSDDLVARMERAAAPILAVTHWFEPGERAEPFPVTIRFVGKRLGVTGRPERGDTFTHDEAIHQVVPGTGPIAVTARVRDVNPGDWEVKASVLKAGGPRVKSNLPEPAAVRPLSASAGGWTRLWLKWAPPVDPAVPVRTRLEPLVRVPGLIPLIWGALVGLGMVVAVIEQAIVATHLRLAGGPVFLATLGAIGAGIVGAKIWYIVKHRRDFIGWCIQGFITGATAGALVLFTVLRVPLGTVLDATAPGLMLGLAVGRVGCFFAGCCGGPPTTASWGVWCSDQHVCARRVPTQLMESLFSLALGLATLAGVWAHGAAGGAYFGLVVAGYTLFREWILRMRTEKVTTRLPVPVTPIVSALAVVAALVFIVR